MGRYYVQTSDGLIVGAPTAPTLDTPPTGATTQVIPDTEGARTGGTWLDPVYTPPAGQPVPYDPDTELGRRQIASTILHEYLKGVTEGIHAVRHEKPQADVEKGGAVHCDGALGDLRRGAHGDAYRQFRNVGRADDVMGAQHARLPRISSRASTASGG